MTQINTNLSGLTNLNESNQQVMAATSDVFSTHVVDDVSRTAYLRLYSKHADVVKNNLSKVSDDVESLYSSVMASFASFETGGDTGGGGLGGGGLGGDGGGFGDGG